MQGCARSLELLPRLVEGSLPRVARWRLERHLASCDPCSDELARQFLVAEGLTDIRAAEALAAEPPPHDLLERLLEDAQTPSLRARAAVPARGAISGARPGLSVAFLVGTLALAALAGWAGWRLGRAVASSRRAR